MPAMRDKLRFLSLCKLASIPRRSQARANSECIKPTQNTTLMKTYSLTDTERETLKDLWENTHNFNNANKLDSFYSDLLAKGFTHTTEINPNSFLSLGAPIEIHTGFVNCL